MIIKLMNDSHLEKILEIDQSAFQRDEPRTVQNLKGLREGDPEGCFVLLDGKEVVGYSFNKTMGDEGYLGPVGIQPSLHGKGWGQKLIQKSLDYLKSHCKVIGLEVRPEAGNNLGLYHKMGFHSAFPSLILEVPEKFQIQPKKSRINISDENSCKDINYHIEYNVELYSHLPEDRKKLILDKIELWTGNDLKGISYKNDLDLINAGDGDIIIISKDDEPLGFLAYYSVVFLHLWGAIKPTRCQKDILREGLHFFRKINPQGEVLIEVNTRYSDLVDFLMGEGFKIRKSVNRMLLEGFEGEYLKKSSDFVMRAWHA
ncbi:MAG: GNAT family N-acetyltransferase [Methanobacteriaceae archaeon]|nr:GNAT family N-acetyltransferase [Methanobacteriaceae archaeon]